MSEPRDDELYIGYLESTPAGNAAFIRRIVILLLAVTTGLALLLTAAQGPFGPGIFEFQVFHTFEGIVHQLPYPTLAVERPGITDGADESHVSHFYLVNPGKFGADVAATQYAGLRVQLDGSLIYREDQTMVELVPGSIRLTPGDAGSAARRSHGVHTLVGEIVDSKCHLGLMKPGSGKPHRACAARCISGGVPPLFLVRDGHGPVAHLLLVGADGEAVGHRVLDRVAEPLEITGEIVQIDDLWILQAEPTTYRRLL